MTDTMDELTYVQLGEVETRTPNGNVVPLHRGHHPIWEGSRYHVDISNVVEEVVVRDFISGSIFWFEIDDELLPWLEKLIAAMDDFDTTTMFSSDEDTDDFGDDMMFSSSMHNVTVRANLMMAVTSHHTGIALQLNIFEPGVVSVSVSDDEGFAYVDQLLGEIIDKRPEAFVR